MPDTTLIKYEIQLSYPDFLAMANKGVQIIKNILKEDPNYYEGILCPLRGGFYFTDFIARRISLPVHYIYISSYHDGKIQKEFTIHFHPRLKSGKRYLICDDILATGNTVKKIMEIYPDTEFEAIVLYRHHEQLYPLQHYYIREIQPDVWVHFFWEKVE